MRKLSKSIDINVTPERAYDHVTRPENLLAIWPSLVEVTNIERKSDGAHSFDWAYKMAGVRFHGKARTTRVDRNKYAEVLNEGGIPSIFMWRYQPQGRGTRVTVDVEYTIPAPVLGKLAEALIAKINEREIETLLDNLKGVLETTAPANAGVAARP
jgi:carbon monoxide dehydrogenase subunit G